MVPTFLTYVLSFVYLGIYWNNHHHLLHAVGRVDGRVLWANLHLSVLAVAGAVATGWLGENLAALLPTAVYGVVLLMPAIAYDLLEKVIMRTHGEHSCSPARSAATSRDVSPCSSRRHPAAFVLPRPSIAIYVLVALIWLIPDRWIECALR